MMRKHARAALWISLFAFTLAGCDHPLVDTVAPTPKTAAGSLLYANYGEGKYNLHAIDSKTLQEKSSTEIAVGWGEAIFKDAKNRIWCPVYYQPDMTNSEKFVEVVDLQSGKKTKVEVGYGPRQVFFSDHGTYVVCEEDGNSPSIYLVDDSLKATKWKTIQDGGLLSGMQFDGENFYFSSLKTNPLGSGKKDYPMLVKIPLQGDVVMQPVADENKGFNNLLLAGDHLYMGLNDPAGTLSEFDKKTLQCTRVLPYQDMVGDILSLDGQRIAVSNYSKNQESGNKITIIDLVQGKPVQVITAKNLVTHVSFVDGKFYIADTSNTKIEVIDAQGNSLKTVDSPTQVSNFLPGN